MKRSEVESFRNRLGLLSNSNSKRKQEDQCELSVSSSKKNDERWCPRGGWGSAYILFNTWYLCLDVGENIYRIGFCIIIKAIKLEGKPS